MASPKHARSPGWTRPISQCMAGTKPKASAPGPDLPRPGPEEHLDAHGSQSSNSSMTTRELQEYWRTQKRCWKYVKLLFEIASARIEEGRVSKFVVGKLRPGEGALSRSHGKTGAVPGLGCPHQSDMVW
uniref:Sorting nexin 20 n=1 Tax=Balaenoptera musculus TaxID=9771 RepID=A0A8C0DH06_BALMU